MTRFSGSRFRSALKYFLLGRAAQGVLSLVFTLLTIRVMVPTEYGAYLLAIGIIDLARPLSSVGILPTMQQFLPEMAMHAKATQLKSFIFWTRALRWGLLALLMVLLYWFWTFAAQWLGLDGPVTFDPLLACLLATAVLGAEFSEAMLEATLEQRYAQGIRLLYSIIRLTGMIGLGLTSQADLASVLWLELFASVVCLIGAEYFVSQRLSTLTPDGSKHFNRDDILQFGRHLFLSQVLYAFATPGAIRLVVANLLGLQAAGQFGFMQTLLGQINRLLPSLLLVNLVRPMLIATRAKGQYNRVADACGLLFKSNVLLVWPLAPLTYLGGNEMMAILSGGRLMDAGLAMTGMTLALVSMTKMQVISIVLQVHRESRLLLTTGFLALLAPIMAAVGSMYSLVGACFGLFVATAVRNVVMTWFMQRTSARVRSDVRGAIYFGIGLLVAFGIALALVPYSTLAAVAAFGLLVVASLPVCRPLTKNEVSVLTATLNRDFPFLKPLVSNR